MKPPPNCLILIILLIKYNKENCTFYQYLGFAQILFHLVESDAKEKHMHQTDYNK